MQLLSNLAKMTFSFITLSLLSLLPGLAIAAEDSDLQLSQQLVAPEHFRNAQNGRPFPKTQRIVNRYIEEKIASGELDPTEFNQLKQQRQDLRQELKVLRESGDKAAVQEKLTDIRQQRQSQRDYMRKLVQDDAELRQRLVEQRQKIRLFQLDRRQRMIERRRERILDRRYRDGAS